MTSSNAAQLGHDTASQIITAQLNRGMDPEAIARHHKDMTAQVQNEARTPDGIAYAREYGATSASLVADMREDAEHGASLAARSTRGRDMPQPLVDGEAG